MRTYLIVPAVTDIAGQCRIVLHPNFNLQEWPLTHYREHPQRVARRWPEHGRHVCPALKEAPILASSRT